MAGMQQLFTVRKMRTGKPQELRGSFSPQAEGFAAKPESGDDH